MRYDEFSMLPRHAFQRVCGRLLLWGKDDDKPAAPDTSAVAAASDKAAQMGYDLGQQQIAESRRQYENNMAVAAPVVDAQLGLMRSQQQQGDEYYNYMKDTFRPVEQGLVADAEAFNEADAKERYARTAATDLQVQQANQEGQNNRAMASMGVNPNSGRFAAITGQQRVMNAAARAGATNNARDRADSLGWAKRMDVTGLGRGLSGASSAAYGQASNAGSAAVGSQMQPGGALMAGMSAGNGTIMQGSGQQIGGLGSALGAQTSMYGQHLNATAQSNAGVGQLVGAGLGAAAMIMS